MRCLLALLISVVVSVAVSRGSNRPYVEVEGERLTIVGVGEDGRAVLENGESVDTSKTFGMVGYEWSEGYLQSDATLELNGLPRLVLPNSYRKVRYEVSGKFSNTPELYGVLTRIREDGRTITILFQVELLVGENGATAELSIDPFPKGSGDAEALGKYFFECRFFENGREILPQGEGRNPLVVDWERFRTTEDSKPEIVLAVHDSLLGGKEGSSTVVEFLIDPMGRVHRPKILSTNRLFGNSAIKYIVECTRFYPAIEDGKAVPAKLRLPVGVE